MRNAIPSRNGSNGAAFWDIWTGWADNRCPMGDERGMRPPLWRVSVGLPPQPAGLQVSAADGGPVDHVPPCIDIRFPVVLILQVMGVFPAIQGHQGDRMPVGVAWL